MGNNVFKDSRSAKSGNTGGHVHVVLLSGECVSYKPPVTARTVMKCFPQHLVLQCSPVPSKSTNSRDVGSQRYKVYKTILKSQTQLKAEEHYLVVPRSSTTIKSIADSWVMFAINKCAEKQNARKQRASARRSKALASLRRMLAHIFRISSPCLLPDEKKRSLSLKFDVEKRKGFQKSTKSFKEFQDSQSLESRSLDLSSVPNLKERSHARSDDDYNASRGSQNRRKLSAWHRFTNASPQCTIRVSPEVPCLVEHNWQPSPDLCKGFLMPLTAGDRIWRPALSCIPESCKVRDLR